MDDELDTLMVEVRASTAGFAADIATMRSAFDSQLLDGFDRAGGVLERSLLTAIRKGSLGFDDLQRAAARALDQIAAQALQLGLDSIFGGAAAAGGVGGLLAGTLGALFGLPGRATGGLVAPQRPYLVGERGPELFVPASAGRVEPSPMTGTGPREVRVAIALNPERGASAPAALRRSSRQIASAVRRALLD
ncbi:tail tape measure protein [Qipengyuania sp. SM2507]